MKKIYIALGIVVILIIVLVWHKESAENVTSASSSYKDATFIIEGEAVTLNSGLSEMEIASSSDSKLITRYFGNEVKHDFDGDGREDVAFILTQSTGGSGTFYYVVAALNTKSGHIGSHGLFLGDRISPQGVNMGKGNIIVVNYKDRKSGESFASAPSVGKSLWLLLNPKTMQFGEVAQNFEGEADPSKMTLGMKTWNWLNTTYANDRVIKPRSEKIFTLTFKDSNIFSATTDCNNVGGEYTVTGTKILFDKIRSTKMYCENSGESDFTKMLGEIQSYHFTSKGELIFDLKFDSGSAIFN